MVELRLRRAMPLRRAPTSSPFGALRINPNSQFVVVLGGRKSSSLPEQMKTKLEKQDRAGRRCPGARPTTGRRLRPVRRSCRWGYCQLSADTVTSTIGLGCSQTFPSRSSTRHCAGRELGTSASMFGPRPRSTSRGWASSVLRFNAFPIALLDVLEGLAGCAANSTPRLQGLEHYEGLINS